MTVQTKTNVASFNGNGVTQIFPIAFKFNNDTDLVVLLVEDATGSVSQLTLNSDYTVSGEGDEEGGLINVVVAPTSGQRLKISRIVDILQLLDLRNQGKFFAEVHEDAFDLLTMIAQQHESGIRSALRVAESDPEPARIPAVAQRAGKLLSFDADGNPTVSAPVADSSTQVRLDLASDNGATLVGESRYGGTVANTLNRLPYFASLQGLGQGADDKPALQALIDNVSAAGGGEIVMDCDSDYLVSDSIYVKSNVTMTFTGSGYIKATQSTSNGAVLVCFSGDTSSAGRVYDVRINNPRVDGNDLGWPGGLSAGENGVAGTNCERVTVVGGHVKNCRRGTSSTTGAGGKGIQFEQSVADIFVIGTHIENCTIASETGGVPANPGVNVNYDITAQNCGRVFVGNFTFTPPAVPEAVNCNVRIHAINCGREDVAGTELDFGAIVLDRYGYANIDLTLENDAAYGKIYSPIRFRRGVKNNITVKFSGECDYLCSHHSTLNGAGQMAGNVFRITHKGTCNLYALAGPGGESVASANNFWDITTDTVTTGLIDSTWQYAAFNARFTNPAGFSMHGDLSAVATQFSNTYGVGRWAMAGTVRFNGLTVSYGTGVQVFDTPDDTDFRRGGASKLRLKSTGISLAGVPNYASDADAGTAGLVAGDVYRINGALYIKQ